MPGFLIKNTQNLGHADRMRQRAWQVQHFERMCPSLQCGERFGGWGDQINFKKSTSICKHNMEYACSILDVWGRGRKLHLEIHTLRKHGICSGTHGEPPLMTNDLVHNGHDICLHYNYSLLLLLLLSCCFSSAAMACLQSLRLQHNCLVRLQHVMCSDPNKPPRPVRIIVHDHHCQARQALLAKQIARLRLKRMTWVQQWQVLLYHSSVRCCYFLS